MKEIPVLLILTDSSFQANFFNKEFAGEYYVLKTTSLSEAFEKLGTTTVDFIVLDEKALSSSALVECCQKIRMLRGYHEIPILVITGQLKKSFTRNLIKAGASDFLSEPLDKEEVAQRMELAMRYHETHKKMNQLSSSLTGSSTPKENPLNQVALNSISQAHVEKKSLGILMIEVDHIEELIKKRGQLVCEELFLSIEQDLKHHLREQDTLLFLGNGKFIAILSDCTSEEAQTIAKKMKDFIFHQKYVTKQGTVAATVSIGLTHESPPEMKEKTPYSDLDGLLKRVTNALGEAKKGGNQVIGDK